MPQAKYRSNSETAKRRGLAPSPRRRGSCAGGQIQYGALKGRIVRLFVMRSTDEQAASQATPSIRKRTNNPYLVARVRTLTSCQ
jgi:hypothetical protein